MLKTAGATDLMALGQERINQIEDIAEGVLRDVYDQKKFLSPPVQLGKIAEFFGIKLILGEFDNPSMIGIYIRDAKVIYVSSRDPNNRQRFTIAHELGHYVLHEGKADEIFHRKDYAYLTAGPLDPIEQEANWFAASLLMPREATTLYWEDLGDISTFARYFKVSISAATYRLKNLGIVE